MRRLNNYKKFVENTETKPTTKPITKPEPRIIPKKNPFAPGPTPGTIPAPKAYFNTETKPATKPITKPEPRVIPKKNPFAPGPIPGTIPAPKAELLNKYLRRSGLNHIPSEEDIIKRFAELTGQKYPSSEYKLKITGKLNEEVDIRELEGESEFHPLPVGFVSKYSIDDAKFNILSGARGSFQSAISESRELTNTPELKSKAIEIAYEIITDLFGKENVEQIELNIKFANNGGEIVDQINNDLKEQEATMSNVNKEINSPKNRIRLDKGKLELKIRRLKLINNIIQGEAKSTKKVFNLYKEKINNAFQERLNEINRQKRNSDITVDENRTPVDIFNKLVDLANISDWEIDPERKAQMMENDTRGMGFAGASSITYTNQEDEGEEGGSSKNKKRVVNAIGIDFPMLIHEAVKGMYELISTVGLEQNIEGADEEKLELDRRAMRRVTGYRNEAHDFQTGPQIAKALRDFINEYKPSSEIKNINVYVYIELLSLEDEEFLKIFRGIISSAMKKSKYMGKDFDENNEINSAILYSRNRINEIIDLIIEENKRNEYEHAMNISGAQDYGAQDYGAQDYGAQAQAQPQAQYMDSPYRTIISITSNSEKINYYKGLTSQERTELREEAEMEADFELLGFLQKEMGTSKLESRILEKYERANNLVVATLKKELERAKDVNDQDEMEKIKGLISEYENDYEYDNDYYSHTMEPDMAQPNIWNAQDGYEETDDYYNDEEYIGEGLKFRNGYIKKFR